MEKRMDIYDKKITTIVTINEQTYKIDLLSRLEIQVLMHLSNAKKKDLKSFSTKRVSAQLVVLNQLQCMRVNLLLGSSSTTLVLNMQRDFENYKRYRTNCYSLKSSLFYNIWNYLNMTVFFVFCVYISFQLYTSVIQCLVFRRIFSLPCSIASNVQRKAVPSPSCLVDEFTRLGISRDNV